MEGQYSDKESVLYSGNFSVDDKAKCCEFCSSNSTPMWRRGPQGKATLCNACGVKWSLGKKLLPGETKVVLTPKKITPPLKVEKEKEERPPTPPKQPSLPAPSRRNDPPVDKDVESSPKDSPYYQDDDYDVQSSKPKDYYYCKYCEQSWPLGYFRNSQQFGAHCSNCSRKRRPSTVSNYNTKERKRFTPDEQEAREDKKEAKLKRQAAKRNASWDVGAGIIIDHNKLESSSTEDTDLSSKNILLVRLINVVENQLVEEQQLDKIRQEVKILSQYVFTREEITQQQLDLIKAQTISQLQALQSNVINALAGCEDFVAKQLSTGGLSQADRINKSIHDTKDKIEAILRDNKDSTQGAMDYLTTNLKEQLDNTRAKLEAVLKENPPPVLHEDVHSSDHSDDLEDDYEVDEDGLLLQRASVTHLAVQGEPNSEDDIAKCDPH